MRGDHYDDYARQLRRDEYDRLFRLLSIALARFRDRIVAGFRRPICAFPRTGRPGGTKCPAAGTAAPRDTVLDEWGRKIQTLP